MHLDWLMMWGARTAPEMAPVGQPWAQRVQPLHLAGSTMYWMQGLAHPGGAALLVHVGLVLLPEVLQGGEHRVGGGLAQAAQGGLA